MANETAKSEKPRAPGLDTVAVDPANLVALYALKTVAPTDERHPENLIAKLVELNVPSKWDTKVGARLVDKTTAPAEILSTYASEEMKQAREAEKAAEKSAKKETVSQARPAATKASREAAPGIPMENRVQVFTVGGRENKDSPYNLGALNKALKDAGVKRGVEYDKEARVYYVDGRDQKQVELAAPYRTPEAQKANQEFVAALDAGAAAKKENVADKATMEAGDKAGSKAKTQSVQPSLLHDPKQDRAKYEAGIKAIGNLAKMKDRAGDVIRMTASEATRMQTLLSTSGQPTTDAARQKQANTQWRADALERGFGALTQAYSKEHGLPALQAEMAKGKAASLRLPPGIKAAMDAAGRDNNRKEAATR